MRALRSCSGMSCSANPIVLKARRRCDDRLPECLEGLNWQEYLFSRAVAFTPVRPLHPQRCRTRDIQ
jgi:hypothetical protein